MFDETGAPSEAVDVMKYIWTGKKSDRLFPRLKYMLVNKKGGQDNVILSSDSYLKATVFLEDSLAHFKKINWELCPEDWFRKDKVSNNQKFIPLVSETFDKEVKEIRWKVPSKEGPYRIFATIYDENGTMATCNTPIYVIRK